MLDIQEPAHILDSLVSVPRRFGWSYFVTENMLGSRQTLCADSLYEERERERERESDVGRSRCNPTLR